MKRNNPCDCSPGARGKDTISCKGFTGESTDHRTIVKKPLSSKSRPSVTAPTRALSENLTINLDITTLPTIA